MRDKNADQGFRKFWPLMKSMTWKERIQHIFYYYAKYALLAAFLIYLGVSLAVDMFSPSPTMLLSGATVNVSISDDMKLTLVEDAFVAMGGTDRNKQAVSLTPYQVTGPELDSSSTYMALQGEIGAYQYHYVITDQTGLDLLVSMPALSDLSMVLSEEKQALLQDRLVMDTLGGKTVPLAIDIRGTALAAACTYNGKDNGEGLFLGFPVSEKDFPVAEAFLDFLIDKELLEIQ